MFVWWHVHEPAWRPVEQGGNSTKEDVTVVRVNRRRMSSQDAFDKVALVIKEIPAKYNSSNSVRTHFSKYGNVSRVFVNPAHNSATVYFLDHVSHESHLVFGGEDDENPQFCE